jgi:hypothetical protein
MNIIVPNRIAVRQLGHLARRCQDLFFLLSLEELVSGLECWAVQRVRSGHGPSYDRVHIKKVEESSVLYLGKFCSGFVYLSTTDMSVSFFRAEEASVVRLLQEAYDSNRNT